jgi:hypothetical protein
LMAAGPGDVVVSANGHELTLHYQVLPGHRRTCEPIRLIRRCMWAAQ